MRNFHLSQFTRLGTVKVRSSNTSAEIKFSSYEKHDVEFLFFLRLLLPKCNIRAIVRCNYLRGEFARSGGSRVRALDNCKEVVINVAVLQRIIAGDVETRN